MNIVINRATPKDAAALLDYLKYIGNETDNLTFGPEGLPFSVEDEASYIARTEHSPDEIMLIAKDQGIIIGNASLSRLPRRMSHRGELSVSVRKDYWNKGIGKQLMSELIHFAKENNFDIVDLQVRSDNFRAIHIYENFGFKKMGTHPAFFKINNDYIPFEYMYLHL